MKNVTVVVLTALIAFGVGFSMGAKVSDTRRTEPAEIRTRVQSPDHVFEFGTSVRRATNTEFFDPPEPGWPEFTRRSDGRVLRSDGDFVTWTRWDSK